MTYVPAADRYDRMTYNRSGRSGLLLPAISLGLWQNFGADRPLETSRAIVRRAFDLGITHFDLANNYGPPYGSAEETFGRLLRAGPRALPRRARDLDEGRLRHVAGALRRLRLAQVPAREPRPEPRGAWGSTTSTSSTRTGAIPARRWRRRWARSTPPCGRARRSTRASRRTRRSAPREAAAILRGLGTPLLIHQPSYSMLNRWIEAGLLDVLGDEGVGCIDVLAARPGHAHRPLPRRHPGRLARQPQRLALAPSCSTEQALEKIRALNEIAAARGQTLAQMALAWTLRDPRVTSTLDRREQRRAARGQRRRARPPRLHAPTSSPRSTATRPTAASTSGRDRATNEPGEAAHAALRPARHPPADPARGHGRTGPGRPSSWPRSRAPEASASSAPRA